MFIISFICQPASCVIVRSYHSMAAVASTVTTAATAPSSRVASGGGAAAPLAPPSNDKIKATWTAFHDHYAANYEPKVNSLGR